MLSQEQLEWIAEYTVWALSDGKPTREQAELRSGIVAMWIVPLSGIEE